MSTLPRLVVHVGTQKTGSSSIQKGMRDSAQSLREHGILYPSLSRSSHPFKHAGMSRAAKNNLAEAQKAEVDALISEFEHSSCHTMILSEESLWRSEIKEQTFDFFQRFRPAFAIEAVVCLRRPDLYLDSLYNQAMRTGAPEECRDIRSFADDPRIMGRLHYASRLEEWSRIADKVIPFEFDSVVRSVGIIRGFFEALGLPSEQAPPEVHAKSSPNMDVILTMRALREGGWPCSAPDLLAASEALGKMNSVPARKHALGSTLRRQILRDLAPEMQQLSRRWGIRFDDSMPEEPSEPQTLPDPEFLLALAGVLASSGPATEGEPHNRKKKRRQKGSKKRRAKEV